MIRNRIVDHILLRGRGLQDNEGNWRVHPQAQTDAVNAILDNIGIVDELLIYKSVRQGGWTVIDGHLRKNEHPDVEWPCTVVDLNDDEADAVLAAFDRLTAKAETDNERLGALIQRVQERDAALLAGVFKRDEVAEILALAKAQQEPVADPGPQVDRAAELQESWGTALGQVWEVGPHRLVCGDCTDAAVVEAAMRGERAGAVVTDPPYGQAYLSNRYGPSRSAPNPMGVLRGDNEASPESLDLWLELLDEGSAAYICSRWEQCDAWRSHIAKTLAVKNVIVWHKNNWSAGDLAGAYGFMYELIIFAVRGRHKLNGKRAPDVWKFDRCPPALHPTQKPVELFAQCIEKSTKPGDLVIDSFIGSGTTAVACQQLGRKCRGAEIEPKYVVVALERLSQMGLEPRLVEQR